MFKNIFLRFDSLPLFRAEFIAPARDRNVFDSIPADDGISVLLQVIILCLILAIIGVVIWFLVKIYRRIKPSLKSFAKENVKQLILGGFILLSVLVYVIGTRYSPIRTNGNTRAFDRLTGAIR